MTAIEAMQQELAVILRKQAECVNDYGVVRPECRYKYQEYVRSAKLLKNGIAYMKERIYPEMA